MRSYLKEFFSFFEYEEKDAETLLSAYDKIAANEKTNRLLNEAVAVYEADININYRDEIIGRAGEIAKMTDVHRYTANLLFFICLTKHLKALYKEKGIVDEIYKNSVLDLKWKLLECKATRGICGSFVAEWFPGFFNLTRFALGRLQFEVVNAGVDYAKNGVVLKKGETKVVNVHIPRTGTPLDKESCDRAYAQAREFFKGEVGEKCVFVCHSWLLYPENLKILPERTNTYRFMSEYDIVDSGYNDGQDLWRLFDTHEMHPDRLPTNGTLRRCYAEHLKKGGRVGWGLGVKI